MTGIGKIRVNKRELKGSWRNRTFENDRPTVDFAVESGNAGDSLKNLWASFSADGKTVWESGKINGKKQGFVCPAALPREKEIELSLKIETEKGDFAEKKEKFFVSGLSSYSPAWIAPQNDEKDAVIYFKREFEIKKEIKRAIIYAAGIGYQSLTVNGENPYPGCALEPLFSDYTKKVYFVMVPDAERMLKVGLNAVGVKVGQGWRRNEGYYLRGLTERKITFFGIPQLCFVMKVFYADGSEEVLTSDESWLCGRGGARTSHLFDGETFDARENVCDWDKPGKTPEGFEKAKIVPAPGGKCEVCSVPPITENERYAPVDIFKKDGKYYVDFGQNIAGVVRLKLPENLKKGQTIVIKHAEFLETDGTLSPASMRNAPSVDTYIASGDGNDLEYFQPEFLYHGFQYASVEGLDLLTEKDIEAVALYSDVALDSSFSSGDPTANAVYKAIIQTEKANIHGILTDCPQRDERMGWMNDATVRFEETPYSFDVGELFYKVVSDICDAQSSDGAITCTAPYVYGQRPADPVCSSFLIAAYESWLFTGNVSAISDHYENFKAWEKCLEDHSDGLIVNYSHYGDWASPVYACVGGDKNIDAVHSAFTPGTFMSTGFFYFNAKMIARFAKILGKTEDEKAYTEYAEKIKKAILDKWYDEKEAKMCGGSEGANCFALWLGLIPEKDREKAAKIVRDDLASRDYMFTTGNITTRYLYDILTEYGYVDDAWKLITKNTYPSIANMIKDGATTVWERFENKKETGMNSHCHPMYGAAGYWFYAGLFGIKPTEESFSRVSIAPRIPKELNFARVCVETVKGKLSVRVLKQWGICSLTVTVPFGMTADVSFMGKDYVLESGSHIIEEEI